MQLLVHIRLDQPLILPINYNHILQSVIYRAISIIPDFGDFVHDCGYNREGRQYKMFQFGQLKGSYRIENRVIIFDSHVSFEVRSPEPLLIRLIADSFNYYGITFGKTQYHDVELELFDYTVEESDLVVRMKSPVTIYSTDPSTGKTYFYNPDESEFYDRINENFYRKYQAYYGIAPYKPLDILKNEGIKTRKIVTKYQSSYVTAWFVQLNLTGERKYLDFLYQTGLGAKNSQGFGMFEIV
ncbi:MAG TPA: CRISPR-associated endoribonuclease Cas6 [Roseburia sp.]|nr:CRISPR-associated endoribonuclease Cas6 [Roseburia sp.]